MTEQKNENDIVRLANLLSDLGYDSIAIARDEKLFHAVTVTVFPPEKDTRK
ncbi:MAG: hypothetical protein FWC64_07960 [Treponema sp.]|nr:hypothetical protein [Treponema sp.]